MRPSIVRALAAIVPFALAACSSNNLGGGGDAHPDGAEVDGGDGGPPCQGRTPQYCLTGDCHTQLWMETCVDGVFTCPAGQRHSSDCSDAGLACPIGQACYSSDCTAIVSCSDVALCPGGQKYPSQCFGPDAAAD